jgi:hypothetical protein
MSIKEYFEKIYETLIEDPKKIFLQAAKLWLIFPFIIFIIYSFYLIIFGVTDEGIAKLFLLAIDASLEWWISAIMNLKKAIAEFIFLFLIILNYNTFN